MSSIQPTIIIIGAGAAGIAAASKLIKNGFNDVIVLEAENRIGGRIHSVPFAGTMVDLGAQWVHGEEDNIIYQRLKNLNFLHHNKAADYENIAFFTSDGSKLNKSLTDPLFEIASDVLYDEPSINEHGGTLEEAFKHLYNERIAEEFGADKEILVVAKLVEEWMGKYVLCNDPAESWNQLSVNSFNLYKSCEGDDLLNWGNKGFSTIFSVLMKNNLNESEQSLLENRIHLNKEVTKIIWNQNSNETKKVTIQCTDGSIYHGDHIIVTLSVAVLKSIHTSLFQPGLPEYKINCVESIHLGNIQKIMLKFPKRWWPDDIDNFNFLWTEEDKTKVLEEFPHGPVYNGRSWLEDIFGFYTIDSHPEILLGWLVGPFVKEIELLPDDIVQNASMYLLRKFVGKEYDIPEPESILRSKWGTNPHFYGTYSYVSTEMEKRGVTNEDLAKPLTVDDKEVVLFAGEATHSKYFSTVHGAIETGYREADRLITKYSM